MGGSLPRVSSPSLMQPHNGSVRRSALGVTPIGGITLSHGVALKNAHSPAVMSGGSAAADHGSRCADLVFMCTHLPVLGDDQLVRGWRPSLIMTRSAKSVCSGMVRAASRRWRVFPAIRQVAGSCRGRGGGVRCGGTGTLFRYRTARMPELLSRCSRRRRPLALQHLLACVFGDQAARDLERPAQKVTSAAQVISCVKSLTQVEGRVRSEGI